MAEYASLKVPELKKLLTDRKLATTGNKPDLVARLQEDDDKGAAPAGESKPAENKEDEISYSDEEAAAPKPAAAAPVATATDAAAESKPADETTDATAAAPEAPKEPATSYAMGLGSSTVDEETRRRAERAKRFGIEEDDEEKKRAERAQRFGIDEKSLASSLDSALPERPLKRGRGREQDGNRSGKRQSTDRRGGNNNSNNNNRRNGRPGGGNAGNAGEKKSSILDDPAERAKAEKRAARFAAA